jgi:hypothetical protein
MRTRHRIPSIFNLSMVDVLCCALGCVILLWLINFREARRRSEAVGMTAAALEEAQGRLSTLSDEAASLRRELGLARTTAEEAEARGAALALERTRQDDEVARLRKRIDTLDKEGKALAANRSTMEEQLANRLAELERLTTTLKAAEKSAEALRGQVKEKETVARAAADQADRLAVRLRETEARLVQAVKESTQVGTLKTDAQALRDQLAVSEARVLALQKDVADQMARTEAVRAAADNRFAGMALTGKRVVFLVDMSGSMDFIDEKTTSPTKWPAVRETIARIIRSLPELERFQVILFSDKVTWLLGGEDHLLPFDPKTSLERVTRSLADVKPKGNTNLYAAFEAAFRYRADGMDTIYLFSDGLPNIGAGLTPEQAKVLKETEQSAVLSQHLRRTLKSSWNRPQPGTTPVRINAIGFFYESPDVGAFLWALARENDGGFVGMSRP